MATSEPVWFSGCRSDGLIPNDGGLVFDSTGSGQSTAAESDDEVLVFDDSFVHWVEHTGSRTRYTLMITFWHPALNPLERTLLRQVVRMAPR